MRGPVLLGLLLLLAIGLGVAGATMVIGDLKGPAREPVAESRLPEVARTAAPMTEPDAGGGSSSDDPSNAPAGGGSAGDPRTVPASGGRVPMIPASPGGVQYVGGKTVTLAARRGGNAFSVEIPARIPALATVSAVMRGTTATSDGGGSIASVYIASGDRCPRTSGEGNDRIGSGVERVIAANAFRSGPFRFGDLPSINLDEGPAIACAYLGVSGKPELTASQRVRITAYRPGLYAKTEAKFPSGTYVASGFDVIGAKSVHITIARGKSPFGDHEDTYIASKVVAGRMSLRRCADFTDEQPEPGPTVDIELSKTSPDLPPTFVGQTATADYAGPDEGSLVGGFAGDGQLHGTITVDRRDGTATCSGSVAFVAHRAR